MGLPGKHVPCQDHWEPENGIVKPVCYCFPPVLSEALSEDAVFAGAGGTKRVDGAGNTAKF